LNHKLIKLPKEK